LGLFWAIQTSRGGGAKGGALGGGKGKKIRDPQGGRRDPAEEPRDLLSAANLKPDLGGDDREGSKRVGRVHPDKRLDLSRGDEAFFQKEEGCLGIRGGEIGTGD